MRKFLDTAPLIYLVEGHPEFKDIVKKILSESIVDNDILITSVITILEFGVKPEKENRQDIILQFRELLDRLNTRIEIVDEEIATNAYKLRAKYKFLKGMDSIQLATAITSGCEEFITNDQKLERIEEINIHLLKRK